MTAGLQDAVEGALATVVADMVPVSGGDVASSFVVTLTDGSRVFAKTHPDPAVPGLEALAASLERFDDGAPPARLHGDLWAGNRLVDRAGRSWLIDPAAHGGHRELDLAMMRLFGEFGPECFAAYQERHPLDEGWEDRVLLHQVAPLVVHALKFGGGYVRAAADAVERYR